MQDTILALSTWKTAWKTWKTDDSLIKDQDAYHLAVKTAKRTSWRTFCGEVDGIIPSYRLHRVLSKDVSYQMGGT
jgi:hypothetical protein